MAAEDDMTDTETPLEFWLSLRARLADQVRRADTEIARLTAPPPRKAARAPRASKRLGPYVLVREDGAVYTGRHTGYRVGGEPKVFRYRGAAQHRALRDKLASSLVLPVDQWKGGRT